MKILVTDDHELFRDGLKLTLSELADDIIFFDAHNGFKAIETAKNHPDLALHLLDLQLPDINGFDILTTFQKQFQVIPVAILTASEKQVDVQQALASGARGFIPKSADREVILNAVRLIIAGDIYIPSLYLNLQTIKQSSTVLESTEFSTTLS